MFRNLSSASSSSAKEQTKRLKEQVSKREEELSRIEQEIQRTYAECERQLGKKLCSKKPPTEPDQGARKSHSESCDRERESERKSEGFKENPLSREMLREQNSGVQKQPVVPSSTHVPSATTAIGKMTELSPPSFGGVVYSSTPFYPPSSVPPMPALVEQHLQFQQPTSVAPEASVGNLMNQPHALPFTAVTVPSLSTICTIIDATITLQRRPSSVFAHLEQPAIFLVHFRPD